MAVKLAATKVENAKAGPKPFKLTDGDGMYLLVSPSANNGSGITFGPLVLARGTMRLECVGRAADAQLIDNWLQKTRNASTRDVLRSRPSPLRDRHRRDAAIEVLVDLGRIRIGREGKSERILRNPALRA